MRIELAIPDAVFAPDIPELTIDIPERVMIRPTVSLTERAEIGGLPTQHEDAT